VTEERIMPRFIIATHRKATTGLPMAEIEAIGKVLSASPHQRIVTIEAEIGPVKDFAKQHPDLIVEPEILHDPL
jgi:hypothetical protein